MFISESDIDKKVFIFNSDIDGENMYGGIIFVWDFLKNFIFLIVFIYLLKMVNVNKIDID